MTILNESQIAFYQQNGYLILNDFIEKESCNNLINQANALVDTFDLNHITVFSTKDNRHAKQEYFLNSANKIHFFLEENAFNTEGQLQFPKEACINKIGHGLHLKDPLFKDFSHSQKILALTQSLGMQQAKMVQSMYIFKQPRIGGEVTCHQDATYLYDEKNSVAGLWFALQDATLENGCLWAIPGGHRGPLKARFKRQGMQTKLETYDKTPWELEKMVPLEVPRGSVIVLHGLLPHMSKENTSALSRHAYTLHCMPQENEFALDNWLQLS